MPKALTQDQVIDRFKQIHGNLYDYTLVEYKNDSTKVKILCKTHGVFEQQPAMHGRGKQGCPKCATENHINPTPSITQEEYLNRVKLIYGKDAYDFSNTIYKDAFTKVRVRCIKHNVDCETIANTLYRGHHVCPICERENRHIKCINKYKPRFLLDASVVHGDIYDYSKIDYKNMRTSVEIICRAHGSFWQKPVDHIHGRNGCPVCQNSQGEERIANHLKLKNIQFVFQHRVQINDSYHYYDFLLPKYNTIIEFNGKQHYEPIKFFNRNGGFNELQRRDAIKAKYCSDNNIKFVIISYKEFDNIEQILDNVL